jgi:hypothetical protein
MRKDMYKVIVERPRRSKDRPTLANRMRKDFDGPVHLGMRFGFGRPSLNENLAPLRRYLHAQVGRPWNKVFSEICANIDRRNTVQQHIHQHIDDFIATDIQVCNGRLVDLGKSRRFWIDDTVYQDLYVDPISGLIRVNKHRRSWRRAAAARRQQEQAEIDARRRVIDGRTLLMHLDGAWFRVTLDRLEGHVVEKTVHGRRIKEVTSETRYDVVLRRHTARGVSADSERKRLYGSEEVYATNKRQLSKQELKAHGLRQTG